MLLIDQNFKRITSILLMCITLVFILSCGGGSGNADEDAPPPTSMVEEEKETDWTKNNGIGPISSLELPETIDEELAAKGMEIYNIKCSACHKPDKKFIGPAPKGIFERRTPAWVMNMILNPEEMVQKDPIAKKLLIEYNGSPMANQNLTEEEARAVVEYFRTL